MHTRAETRSSRTARTAAEPTGAAGGAKSKTAVPSARPAAPRLVQLAAVMNPAEPAAKPAVAQAKANATGLPDGLKSGVESLSGMSLDHVRVHRNSSKPAELQAHAFAQGSDIHVAPGQEKHLPHEAWHVVQQAQGRVRPTVQAKGVAINDDASLEHEADRMGARAIQRRAIAAPPSSVPFASASGAVAQCALQNPLPPGAFLKSTASALEGEIAASLADFRAEWNRLRPRYLLYTARHVPLPDTNAYRTAYNAIIAHFTAIDQALLGKFTGPKRNAFRAAYDAIRAEEQAPTLPARFVLAEAELNSFLTQDQLATQQNSANRIILALEGKTDTGAGGGGELFGDAGMARASATQWNFTRAGQAWQIHFIVAANAAHGLAVAVDAAGHRLNVTINDFVIPQPQQGFYEREIADDIAAAFRTHHNVGGVDRLRVGVAAGAALSANDQDKLARLQLTLVRLNAEKANYDAAPHDPRRAFRWRQVATAFDRQVRAMDLSAPAKRNLLQQAGAGFTEAARNKAEAHGISHQIHAEAALAGSNPANDPTNVATHIITPEVIEHLIAIEARPPGDFQTMGLSGGHDEQRLLAWVRAHPEYAVASSAGLVETDVDVFGRGYALQFRRYHQYRWTGAAAAPTDRLLRPPNSLVNWQRANVPKTTVHGLIPFLHDARAAYLAWHAAAAAPLAHGGVPEREGATFGRVQHDQAGVTHARSGSGVEYAGYIRADPLRGLRKVETLFAAENFLRG